jgi:hypothetical protein
VKLQARQDLQKWYYERSKNSQPWNRDATFVSCA